MNRGYAVNSSTGKIWSLDLTPSGKAAARKSKEIIAGIDTRLFAGIPEEDVEVFERVMHIVSERADSAVARAPFEFDPMERSLLRAAAFAAIPGAASAGERPPDRCFSGFRSRALRNRLSGDGAESVSCAHSERHAEGLLDYTRLRTAII